MFEGAIGLIWPFSWTSMPTWTSVMVVLVTMWVRICVLKQKQVGLKSTEEKKKDTIVRTMEALQEYVSEKDTAAKKEGKKDSEIEGLPEASRVLSLVWDDVHFVRTTEYGISPHDERNVAMETLLKRVASLELKKAITMTENAQVIATGKEMVDDSSDQIKEIMEYWSGEKLQEKIDFTKDTLQKWMGKEFVDEEALKTAQQLLKTVRKDQRKNMNALLKIIAPVVPLLIFAMILMAAQTWLQMVFHQIGFWMTPVEAAVQGDWEYARAQLLRIFVGHVIIDALGLVGECFIRRAENVMNNQVKNGVLHALLQQDYEYFDKTPPGMLQERLNRDADQLGQNIIHYPNDLLRMSTRVFCGLVFSYQQVPSDMFLMAVAPLGPIIVAQWFLVKYFQKMDERERKLGEYAASSTSEILREIKTVRQFAMERKEASKFSLNTSMCQELIEEAQLKHHVCGCIFGVTIYGGLILTVWMGAARVAAGELTVSALMDTTFKLNFDVVFTLREIIEKLPQVTKLLQPLGRISELLHTNPKIEPTTDEPKGLRPERFHGRIEFEDVHFAYPKDPRKPVLKGLTFTVEPGQKVALIGHTGCGKSSTMSLLQRLYDPQKGVIKIDGKPLKDYDIRYLRSRIVIVDQFTVLFAMSVRENIVYGMENVPDSEIEKACKEAAVWDFMQEKPDKLMTQVAVGGGNFSGGQRQRIAIARAIVRRPDVILLDEATASLDAQNEKLVQQALDKLAKKGSALVIAHRLSTVKDSDKIVVVDQGKTREEGTHEELLKREKDAPEEGGEFVPMSRASSEATPKASARKMKHTQTFHGLDVVTGDGGECTYKKLWDAASGEQEKMTMNQMNTKIAKMEEEVAALRGKMSKMKAQSAGLQIPGKSVVPGVRRSPLSRQVTDASMFTIDESDRSVSAMSAVSTIPSLSRSPSMLN